jgi:small GTP-binding protein
MSTAIKFDVTKPLRRARTLRDHRPAPPRCRHRVRRRQDHLRLQRRALLLAGGAVASHHLAPRRRKTTLEHLRCAPARRARGENRRTRSDWMKIERERGISVSASVMTFDHAGLMFNLLDTPGHEDFSEDTYRTLTAADAAVMVLDAAKGIEPQTLKLFEVCRLRDIPIITFINKMDREALDPYELLDEIGSKLALDPAPLYWPAGSGGRFRGVVDLRNDRFLPYTRKLSSNEDDQGHPGPVDHEVQFALLNHLDSEELAELAENADARPKRPNPSIPRPSWKVT